MFNGVRDEGDGFHIEVFAQGRAKSQNLYRDILYILPIKKIKKNRK